MQNDREKESHIGITRCLFKDLFNFIFQNQTFFPYLTRYLKTKNKVNAKSRFLNYGWYHITPSIHLSFATWIYVNLTVIVSDISQWWLGRVIYIEKVCVALKVCSRDDTLCKYSAYVASDVHQL